jgi:hypothetical protein
VLTAGLLALIGGFNSARKLTLLNERRTAMAHRAQLELERLQTYPYSELAMISKPAHSAEKTNPDYYVNYTPAEKCTTAEPCFAWDANVTSKEEPLAIATKEGVDCAAKEEAGCGLAAISPTGRECSKYVGACEWKDGLVEGYVYDFITNHTDTSCVLCKEKQYKRLTVVVTAKVTAGNHVPAAVRVSTLII